MLQLDQIKFTSDTSELDTAAKKIESLGTAISALSTDLAKLDKASSTAAKSQNTIATAAEDAAKAEQQLSKAKTSTVSSTDAATRAVEKQTLAMKIFRGEAIDLNDQVLTLGSSFTKGQAGQLANLKLLGATNEQLKTLSGSFEDFNKITSQNTFDNSAAGLGKLSKEIFELKKVNDLMQRGVALTRDEIVNLVRDSERLTQQFKSEGLSAQQTIQALGGLEAQTIKLAKEKNELIARTRASELAAKSEASVLEKAALDSAKANGFLSREMERVDNVITGFNNNLNVTSSNRLMKFREQLKLSGTDAATAASMLKVYEEKLKTINAVGQSKAKNSREEELRYLARATSVQLGDIGISLAGGQNPLLVLIQQGDQLRGVLNQVSANGQEMQKALSMAFSQIVVGSKDVVMALGSFVVGAFADSGRAVARFGSDILGVSGAIERLKAAKFAEWAAEGEAGFTKISRAMKASELAVSALGAGIGVFVALGAASAIALLQVTNATDDLTRSLIATGAKFGITSDQAQAMSSTLRGMGATSVDVLNAFNEISKAGNISSDSMLKVAEAALSIERIGGPAVKETVKLFSDLKDKTVETLSKYAEQTGLVTTAQIEYVAGLIATGKEVTAVSEATDILTKAMTEQASITYAALSPLNRLWIDIKNSINNAWGSLQDFTSSSGLLDGIAKVVGISAAGFAEVMYQLARGPRLMAEMAATAMALGKDAANLDTNLTEFNKIRTAIKGVDREREAEHNEQMDRLLQRGNYTSEILKKEAEAAAKLRAERSQEAEDYTKLTAVQKKIKEEVEKLDTKGLTRQEFINKSISEYNKLAGERNKLNGKNLADIEKIAAAEWDKANKPKKQPKSDAMKGAEDDASWYRKSIERIDDLKNKTIGAVEQLSKAQVLLRDLGDDDSFKKLSAQQQMRLVDRINEIDLLEEQLALEKEQKRVATELTKIANDNAQFSLKEQSNVEKILSSSQLKLSLLGKTADEQFAITEAYELQNKLNETGLRFDQQRLKLKQEFEKIKPTSGEDRRLAEAAYAASLAEINAQEANTRDALMQESANKFQAAYIEKILNIGKTLSDAITTALFEGGQAGTKKLKDYIVGIFREKINVSINAVVNAGLNSLIGGVLGGSGIGGLAQTAGAASNGIGMFSGIASAVGSFSSTAGAVAQGVYMGAGELGSLGFGEALSTGLGAVMEGSIASGFATLAGTLGPALMGVALLSNLMDYKVESKGNGLTATIGGSNGLPSGAVGTYQEFEQTGGLFGGGTTTNRSWGRADQRIADYISQNVQSITEANRKYGESLGLTSESITNFTRTFDINLTGMDAAAQQAAINAELATFATEQASATYGAALVGIAREGETTAQTLQRLSTDLTGVNAMFGTLGYTLYDISVTGANAASTLASAFGGLAAAQQQLGSFYENFYSQEEQQANIYRSVQADLAGAGLTFSEAELRAATRGDIRSAVDQLAQNTGTEQGATQYAAAVRAANALSGIKPVPVVVEPTYGNTSGGGSVVSAGEDAAKSITNAWQSITDSIWGEVKRIRGLLQESSGNSLELAKQEFERATAAARSGDQEAAKALPELSQTLLTIAQGQSSTLIELRRAQALTANSLEQTVTGLASNYGLTVPAFASGGSYSGGLALVGEQGPELINFNQGGYVHTAGQTASMMGGSTELVNEIRRLNAKVDQLEAAAVSTAVSNSKIQKILERVTPESDSVNVSGTVTTI